MINATICNKRNSNENASCLAIVEQRCVEHLRNYFISHLFLSLRYCTSHAAVTVKRFLGST